MFSMYIDVHARAHFLCHAHANEFNEISKTFGAAPAECNRIMRHACVQRLS